MFKATVNGKTYELEDRGADWLLNGQPVTTEISKLSDHHFHVRRGNRGYRVELVSLDKQESKVQLKINGRLYGVVVRNKLDLLLERLGMNQSAASKLNVVKAPMPGLIIDLRVKEGDEVKQGDPLLVLEAMKMENILKAPGQGKVSKVRVKKGDSVEKNQVLLEF